VHIEAVIFDLGGVLLRTTSPEVRSRLEQELGFAPGTLDERIWGGPEWQLAEIGAITYEEYWQRVGATLGLTTSEQISAFRQEYFSQDHLDQELIDLIRRLRSRYKIGLLSNAPDRLGYWLKDNWYIEDVFDAIVYSADAGLAKPDPRIYRLILDRLDVQPSEALFIDDSPVNVEGAAVLGMKALRFTDSQSLKDKLGKYLVLSQEETSP
jgi:epoxide hydrolase-like predicted phosphatase